MGKCWASLQLEACQEGLSSMNAFKTAFMSVLLTRSQEVGREVEQMHQAASDLLHMAVCPSREKLHRIFIPTVKSCLGK